MPPPWKPELEMASVCLPFKYQLNREKIALDGGTEHSSDLSFILESNHFHSSFPLLVHGPNRGWYNEIMYVPVTVTSMPVISLPLGTIPVTVTSTPDFEISPG